MRKIVSLLFQVLLLSGLVSVSHGGLYRWVDEDGNVHYSDSVPPAQVPKGHTELSGEGVQIKKVPRAKTPEEAEKEAELQRFRKRQEELLEQQREEDEVLLKTFRTEDDMKMARDGKMASVDVLIEVNKSNVRRHQDSLVALRGRAANLERTGKPIPEHLSESISKTERAIRAAYGTIIRQETKKDSIFARFEKDLARFRQLNNLPARESETLAQQSRPILHNIVPCSAPEECDRLWEKATTYVRQHATTAAQASSANIFITAPPATEQEVSLILSRIDDPEGTGASLFLDLRCHRSVRGKEVCQGEQAQGILKGFRQAIVSEDVPRP